MPKFTPKRPFQLAGRGVDGESNFGNQTKSSRLISELIRAHIEMGSVTVTVYRIRGTFEQDADALGIQNEPHGKDSSDDEALFDPDDSREDPYGPSGDGGPTDVGSFLGVQDTILNENRDREYDFDEIPILHGVYTVSQNELQYSRFGMALANDVITMEFHAESVEKELERRFVPGDVVELPHLREVGIDGRVANKWYEVASTVWSPTGYDPMYARHVRAVTLKPLRHQQEFLDLFERYDQYGKTLADQMSNREAVVAMTEANQQLANEQANTTWFDTTLLYFCPDHPSQKPYRWTDDDKPPNGLPVSQGADFPPDPQENDWFLRVDFVPNKLFQFLNGRWKLMEEDHKREWQPYNWVEKIREHMTDRTDKDRERFEGVEFRSIHDVLTEREDRSNPSPDNPTTEKEPYEPSTNEGLIDPGSD